MAPIAFNASNFSTRGTKAVARIRSIKPSFFRHKQLQELETVFGHLRPMLVYQGLWMLADREGRFKWDPQMIKLDVLPFIAFDMEEAMDLLEDNGFIVGYAVEEKEYGYIPSFKEHQVVNPKEAKSVLPAPGDLKHPPVKEPGYVYVLLAEIAQKIKVGFAQFDPLRRAIDLSCGSPEELKIIHVVRGTRHTERAFHQSLCLFKSHREWFHWNAESQQILSGLLANTSDASSRVAHASSRVDIDSRVEGKGKEYGNGKEVEGSGIAPACAVAQNQNSHAHEPEIPVDSDLLIQQIAAAHPRCEKPVETHRAIIVALEGTPDRIGLIRRFDGDSLAALKFLLDKTQLYKRCTDSWPPGERNFITSSRRWFESGCYDETEETWRLHSDDRAGNNGTKADERANHIWETTRSVFDEARRNIGGVAAGPPNTTVDSGATALDRNPQRLQPRSNSGGEGALIAFPAKAAT